MGKPNHILLLVISSFLPLCANAAILYDVIDLGTLGGEHSEAYSVNDHGQVVGWASNSAGDQRATIFDPTGAGDNIDLGTVGGYGSWALAINDAGTVVGLADSTPDYPWGSPYRATMFDATGQGNNRDLGTLGGLFSVAFSINNKGQIVGEASGSAGYRATLFDPTSNGNNVDLGTLGGSHSQALSINQIGQIVGGAIDNSGHHRAALFDPTGAGDNLDLGTLGGNISEASSINIYGQIVGVAFDNADHHRATLFDPTGNGNNIDLGTLGGSGSSARAITAYAINNHGTIVGGGFNPQGDYHAFLLKPIPEPATIALLGLGSLLIRRRWK